MQRDDRLIRTFAIVIGTLRIGNLVVVVAALLAFVGTLLWGDALLAHLRGQYGGVGGAALVYLRILMIGSVPLAYAVERLLRALAELVATLRAGEPFASANVERLRIVGWALLAIQSLDVALGLSTFWAKAEHIRVVDWTPSFTGWLGVLAAFVLARVFAHGAAMRDDLAGTV